MNPSILLNTTPSSPHPKTLLVTPFLSPFTLRPSSVNLRRQRYRISTIRSSSDQTDVFGEKKELKGVQSLVDAMSTPVRIASSALIAAAAVAAGYVLGSRFGGSRYAGLGGALVVGAAGAGAAYALNSCAPDVAAAKLHNYFVECDPEAVNTEDIEAIANKYGVSKQNEAFNAELCDIYCRFVSGILPPPTEDLRGDEVDNIIRFKTSLGIDDPDAAAMHMEIGRRIFRQRLETGDREGDMEQRRAFQKLIYISNLVFGEASGFLLPWKRVFKVTASQVEVAVRDNAQRLYRVKLESISRDIDVSQLISLREGQLLYRLSDELAEDLFREHTRKLVEQNITAAISVLKSRTREVQRVIEELDKILSFNNLLVSLQNHPDASRFTRGVGPVNLIGGDYDGDRKVDDLKLLYRAYVTDALSGGRMEDNKLASLNQLRNIFGLGRREAETIAQDVTRQVYRRHLQQAVLGGDLLNANSKAAYLQNLCEELHFDAEEAIKIHEEIYRRKLDQLVADKGELSDEDVKTLEQIQIMFCIPKQTVEAAHADICGGLFEKVVKEAIDPGVDGYDAEIKKSVRKAAFGLRLTRETALSIASKAVRKKFINYIQIARSAGRSAKELKKMLVFNSLVVTELVADIKADSADIDIPPPEEPTPIEEPQPEDIEDWEGLQSLRKVRPTEGTSGKPSQKEINLKDDLPARDRADLYKTYLMFCQTGEVTRIPFGAQITTKKDDSEYVFLNQLGGILGMTGKEMLEVHRSLAEQAFRQEAERILADGQLTKSRIEQLNELQTSVGLPPQYAQKIINGIITTKLSAALETAAGRGRLSIKEIRELKENGFHVDGMIDLSLREVIFKKTVDDIFSSGTGEFDEEEVYEKIPKDLNIDSKKAKRVVRELARTRLSNSLLQAVALLRQGDQEGVINSINDLLACDKAVPSTPLSWEVQEELGDLFLVYLKSDPMVYLESDPTAEKLARVQYLLNISDSAAETLRSMKGRREAETIAQDVTRQVYRRHLQQAVSGGDLLNANSKAAYLQNLCEEPHFDAEEAIKIHEEIYRRKLDKLVVDKGELSDEDVKTLEQIQIMFCIPKQTVEAAHADICGGLFEKVVKEAIDPGVDGYRYDAEIKKSVRKAAFGLRLTRETALSIASKAVRKKFINYIQSARSAGRSAKELKKMLAFNSLVVTELVADIKADSTDIDIPPPEEPTPIEEPQPEDIEDWEALQSLRKVRPTEGTLGKPSQKEINLKDDLPERDRADLYKTYLMFCQTGEVTTIPLGAQITTKKDDSEYVFLNQLGGILGMTDKEMLEVHRSLAEQAFRQEAERILADGQLTKSRIEQLNELQTSVGLPPQYAQMIINGIITTKLSAALETATGRGRLSIEEIRELKEDGFHVDGMIDLSSREVIFKKTVDDIFSSGTGEFDEEEVYEKIPKDLNIDAKKAKRVVHELARTRLSNSLVQAVALLRQRDQEGVVNSINDLLACDKAVPSTPLSWEVQEELGDLFLVYLKSDPTAEKLARVQYLLNISDSAAETL